MRMGANGMPMPEKETETLQEILEVNPNAKKKKKEDTKYEWTSEELTGSVQYNSFCTDCFIHHFLVESTLTCIKHNETVLFLDLRNVFGRKLFCNASF